MADNLLPRTPPTFKLGFIVPSTNTVVESTVTAVLDILPKVQSDDNEIFRFVPIFTRMRVDSYAGANGATGFAKETLQTATRLLADAEPNVIVWAGTTSMWITGPTISAPSTWDIDDSGGQEAAPDTGDTWETQQRLVDAMTEASGGIPCTTAVLAMIDGLYAMGVVDIALATPFSRDVTSRAEVFFTTCGFKVRGSRMTARAPSSEMEVANMSHWEIRDVIHDATQFLCDSSRGAVVVPCTDFAGAALVDLVERLSNVVVVDGVLASVWWSLQMVGYQHPVTGWGRLFERFRLFGRGEYDFETNGDFEELQDSVSIGDLASLEDSVFTGESLWSEDDLMSSGARTTATSPLLSTEIETPDHN